MANTNHSIYVGKRTAKNGNQYIALYVDLGYAIRNISIDRALICEVIGCYAHEIDDLVNKEAIKVADITTLK